MDTLYIIVPCYNEQEVLPETSRRLREKVECLVKGKKVSAQSRIVFVDDGSEDNTWAMVEDLHRQNSLFSGIKLSRNRGHQNALMAGLMSLRDDADVLISLDADLQDDVDAIDMFLEKYDQGFDIVYGVRSARPTDTFLKKRTAQAFYRIMKLLGTDIVEDHADYRLMSKRAVEALATFKEVNLFLRGLVPLVGFRSCVVYYERHERFAGSSKYPLKKMLGLALDGVTSLSIKPIRIIALLGFLLFLSSLLMTGYFLMLFFHGGTVPGWTTITISVWAIGGLQLLAIGVVGEYIGKVYLETKNRPKYIIEKVLNESGCH